ncbi:formylglycine-generating enzyme family protein [Pendulispora albinea]|uniref:Formylglycine-generating enzyme family protein n=1 Tax=Pendulispora albinea TaxID=2741071 RepID=A0ABZ2MC49_9BACT
MTRPVRSAWGLVVAAGAMFPSGALGGCSDRPPEGHIVLHIDTDAPVPSILRPPPVPRAAGIRPQLDLTRTPALFDRLRVEFYSRVDETPCSTCVGDFQLDEGTFSRGATVTARGNVDRVRVRLYRSADQNDGDITPGTTVEVVARLPPHGEENAVHASVFLATETMGQPTGKLDAPIPASLDLPEKSKVGTWKPAKRTNCLTAPRSGEVCVPGGAYIMGGGALIQTIPDPRQLGQRIATISPFFLDSREVTVRAIRGWLERTRKPPESVLERWNRLDGPEDNHCTYDRDDALPINCIAKEAAREYCQSLGADLPTEGEYEYVAGGMTSLRYVWGKDNPECHSVIWNPETELTPNCPTVSNPVAWAENDGKRTRDQLVLPTGTIYDLAGNLSEMVLDVAATEKDPCWPEGGSRLIANPLCTKPSLRPDLEPLIVLRGGNWTAQNAILLRAALRAFVDSGPPPAGLYSTVGFRCARHL